MITIDDREVAEAQAHHGIYLPDKLRTPNIVRRLEAGDFAFLDRNTEPLGIERCALGNFIQKLRSGELEDQLRKCQELYTIIILLIEGVYDEVGGLLASYNRAEKGYWRSRVYPLTKYSLVSAFISSVTEMGIWVAQTANLDCSIIAVDSIYEQRTKPEERRTLFRRIRAIRIPVKMSSNPAVPKLLALCPRMPEKVAIALVNQYGSIWNVLHTEDSELLQVEGLGKGLLSRLKKEVGKE